MQLLGNTGANLEHDYKLIWNTTVQIRTKISEVSTETLLSNEGKTRWKRLTWNIPKTSEGNWMFSKCFSEITRTLSKINEYRPNILEHLSPLTSGNHQNPSVDFRRSTEVCRRPFEHFLEVLQRLAQIAVIKIVFQRILKRLQNLTFHMVVYVLFQKRPFNFLKTIYRS